MKIESLEIDGFGVWNGLKLDGLADRLTVFHGPNEAGKTTLLQFIRTVLYGFSPQRRQRYLPPLRGGRPGGALQIRGPAGLLTVTRHAGATRDSAPGELRIATPAGTLEGDHVLAGLLGGIDETTFNHLFAVGLREMQELGTLSDSAAAELLYQLSTGLNGVSLAEVLGELAASRERLLAADHPCQIEALLDRRDKLKSEIDELRGLVHRQASLTHQHNELTGAIVGHETRRAEMEQQARLIEAAVTVRASWRHRESLLDELAGLPPLAPVPPDALERLAAIDRRLAERRLRLTETTKARRAVRREIASLAFDHRLDRCAPRIEALTEQEGWLTTLEGQVEHLAADLAAQEAELAQHKQALGLDAGQSAGELPRAAARLAKLRPAARAVREPRVRRKAAQTELADSQALADTLASQIRAGLRHTSDKELSPALERAGNLVAQLRRRVQLDERLEQLARHETELAEQGRQLLDRQLLPGWVLVALGSVFVLGTVLILSTFFLSAAVVGHAGWALATIGALGAAGAAGGKFLLERAAATQLDVCQKQAGILAAQIKQSKQERDAVDAELPRGGGPLLTRLQTAEKDLAALEELLGVESQRQAALKTAAAAQARIEAADADGRAARRRWRQALAAAGLPENLSPSQAGHYASRRRRLAPLESRLAQQRQELEDRRRELETLTGRIRQLMADVGLEAADGRASDQLIRLRQALADHQTVAARRDELLQRAERLRRRQAKLTRALSRGEAQRKRVLHDAGAETDTALQARAAEQARRQSLAEQSEQLSREIAAALAGRLSEADVATWLQRDDADNLETRWDELAGQIQAVHQELQELFEHRGRITQELEALAGDRRPGERALELAEVQEQLRQAIERWRVLAVTELTLDSVRCMYETERQPEALADASQYLQRLTEGRYTRIWTPLGERTLRVDDGEGNSLPVEVLSRGTREQLFLSLRLALVAAYSRRGIELPLVLDDVLVNFDAKRGKAAALALRDFASAGHQVLVFTCHEHLCKVFKSLKVVTHELPANDDTEPVTVAYARPEPAANETEPPGEEQAPAAVSWQPEPPETPLLQVDDVAEGANAEPTVPLRRQRRRRSPPEVNRELSVAAEGDDLPEAPHPVTVVRGRAMPHPFADARWQEPIDDDLQNPVDERFYSDSDDWKTIDADEPDDTEAA